jgi:hypothetical protein
MKEHPITPPDELVMEWIKKHYDGDVQRGVGGVERTIAAQAARWGADMELDACCSWVEVYAECGGPLRAARRPKPPTLKERGREALQNIHNAVVMETGGRELDVLKEIVESLPD